MSVTVMEPCDFVMAGLSDEKFAASHEGDQFPVPWIACVVSGPGMYGEH